MCDTKEARERLKREFPGADIQVWLHCSHRETVGDYVNTTIFVTEGGMKLAHCNGTDEDLSALVENAIETAKENRACARQQAIEEAKALLASEGIIA